LTNYSCPATKYSWQSSAGTCKLPLHDFCWVHYTVIIISMAVVVIWVSIFQKVHFIWLQFAYYTAIGTINPVQ
jgi:hypothetical protein